MRKESYFCDRCGNEFSGDVSSGVTTASITMGGNGSMQRNVAHDKDFCHNCWNNISVVIDQTIKALDKPA